jgi:hypothetical protein
MAAAVNAGLHHDFIARRGRSERRGELRGRGNNTLDRDCMTRFEDRNDNGCGKSSSAHAAIVTRKLTRSVSKGIYVGAVSDRESSLATQQYEYVGVGSKFGVGDAPTKGFLCEDGGQCPP